MNLVIETRLMPSPRACAEVDVLAALDRAASYQAAASLGVARLSGEDALPFFMLMRDVYALLGAVRHAIACGQPVSVSVAKNLGPDALCEQLDHLGRIAAFWDEIQPESPANAPWRLAFEEMCGYRAQVAGRYVN